MSTLFLCGAGNPEGVRLARRVRRATGRWDHLVLLDDDGAVWGKEILGLPVAAGFDRLADAVPGDGAVNLVARTTRGRRVAQERLDRFGVRSASLVDPVVDTDGANLETGVTIYAGAHVGPEVHVARGVVVFMGAIVGHESVVGAGAVVAANAVLNARVRLGEAVYVGTNATVLPELSVGAWATVGAGSVVMQDVGPGSTVLGVPAAELCGAATRANAFREVGPREAPSTALERAMATLWSSVLGDGGVAAQGNSVNFFEAGGDSLGLIRLAGAIRRDFGVEVGLADLIKNTTVKGMAAVVENAVLRGAGEENVHRALEEVGLAFPT